MRSASIRLVGTFEADEKDLPAIGDAALGLESGMFYSGSHESTANTAFVDALKAAAPTAGCSIIAHYANSVVARNPSRCYCSRTIVWIG